MTTIKVECPYWSVNEEEQEYILVLAFLYKLGIAYGFRNIFTVYDADVRIMLGKIAISPKLDLAKKHWSKFVQVGQIFDDRSTYKLKFVDPERFDSKRAIIKEITGPRCQMIWIYLQGCFNNNLVEKPEHNKRMGVDRVLKAQFLKGFQ
jgi:hypothetical protein